MSVVTGAEAFSRDGGDVAVLLCHGFTGSPQSLRPWAERLAAVGYTVRLPRLPGHGTTWQEMNQSTWQQWYAEAEGSFRDAAKNCSRVFVAGLSMGGCLALRLAEEHGDAVAGLVLVNPAVQIDDPKNRYLAPLLARVLPSLPGITDDIKKPGVSEGGYSRIPLRAAVSLFGLFSTVVSELPKVTQPVLLLHSRVDHVVSPENSRTVLSGISSVDRKEIILDNSYHVATLDNDAEVIVQESLAFISRVTASARS